MYWLPKLHKTPFGQRFIAASSQCTTTYLSKLLARVFQQYLDTLRAHDDQNLLRNGGVRRYFVVHSHEEVTRFFTRYHRSDPATYQLHTGDFSTMYTTIPHPDLIRVIREVTDEVFGIARSALRAAATDAVVLYVSDSDNIEFMVGIASSLQRQRITAKRLTANDVMVLLELLLSNIYREWWCDASASRRRPHGHQLCAATRQSLLLLLRVTLH